MPVAARLQSRVGRDLKHQQRLHFGEVTRWWLPNTSVPISSGHGCSPPAGVSVAASSSA
jgi:hypothetical protein